MALEAGRCDGPSLSFMSDQEQANGNSLERRRRLAEALGIDNAFEHSWSEEDLGEIFRSQLRAPVVVDLSAFDPALRKRLALLAKERGLLLRSYEDLLAHPCPPVELLELTKRFAKANRGHPESDLPDEVATVLYFASIAAALVHCGKRISALPDQSLEQGFTWSAGRSWITHSVEQLLAQAKQLLDRPS